MRKTSFCTVASAVFVCLSASAIPAETPEQTRHEIAALYQKRHVAAANKDLDGILAPLSPDFVYVYPDGRRQNYAHTRQKVLDALTYARTIKSEGILQNFASHGSQATVQVRSHLVLTYISNRPVIQMRLLQDAAATSPDADEAKPVVDEAWAVSVDTWVKTPPGWKISSTRILSERHKTAFAPAMNRRAARMGKTLARMPEMVSANP